MRDSSKGLPKAEELSFVLMLLSSWTLYYINFCLGYFAPNTVLHCSMY